jgi:hypothetical protein
MTREFQTSTCQWIGEGSEIGGCRHPVVEGKSYCENHVWLVYQKGTSSGQRRKDKARAENTWNILSELEMNFRDMIDEGVVEEA